MRARAKAIWRHDTWVAPYLKEKRGLLLAALGLGVVAYGFAAALMFTSGYMISLAATLPLTVLALHIPSLFVRIFGIGKPLLQYVQRLSSHDWVLRMTSSLRVRLYTTLERQGSAELRQRTLGESLGMFSDDIEHIQDLFLRSVLPLTIALCLYGLLSLIFGLFCWQLGCFLLIAVGMTVIGLPLLAMGSNAARVRQRAAAKRQSHVVLTDDILSMRDWRLSGRREDLLERSERAYEAQRRVARRIDASLRCQDMVSHILFASCIVAILLWSAWAFSASGGEGGPAGIGLGAAVDYVRSLHPSDALAYGPNWIGAFVLCFFPLIEAFSPAARSAVSMVSQTEAVADLNRCTSLTCSDPRTRPKVPASPCDDPGQSRKRALEEIALEARDVSFSYPSSAHPALCHLNLEVPQGQHVAILGRSGAGKSTLLSLLAGEVQPTSGSVQVCGSVAVVEQAPYVFRQSIRENLLLADPRATDDELMSVLERVHLSELARSFEQGLDTPLSEGGITLSGGEKHRLALARVLLARSEIILLDEPYRGLDSETQSALSDELFEAFGPKTWVCITHRMEGIERYDRVILMEDGRCIADGAPEWLMKDDAYFRKLARF